MVLAAGGWPGGWTVGWATAAMVGARTCAMATNRVVDRVIDARNPRTAERHLPTGTLRVRAQASRGGGRRAHARRRGDAEPPVPRPGAAPARLPGRLLRHQAPH